jgi:hypothetical protein
MGEGREIIDLMKTTPPEKIRWLTRTELASTRLATEERGAETLIAPPPTRTAQAGTHPLSTYGRLRDLANVSAPERSAVKTDTVSTYSRLRSFLQGATPAPSATKLAEPRRLSAGRLRRSGRAGAYVCRLVKLGLCRGRIAARHRLARRETAAPEDEIGTDADIRAETGIDAGPLTRVAKRA